MKSKHSFKRPPNRTNTKDELIDYTDHSVLNKLKERYRLKGNLFLAKAERNEQKKRSSI